MENKKGPVLKELCEKAFPKRRTASQYSNIFTGIPWALKSTEIEAIF